MRTALAGNQLLLRQWDGARPTNNFIQIPFDLLFKLQEGINAAAGHVTFNN